MAKLVARLRKLSEFESRHLSKMQNGSSLGSNPDISQKCNMEALWVRIQTSPKNAKWKLSGFESRHLSNMQMEALWVQIQTYLKNAKWATYAKEWPSTLAPPPFPKEHTYRQKSENSFLTMNKYLNLKCFTVLTEVLFSFTGLSG